jgi:hypothetical protein
MIKPTLTIERSNPPCPVCTTLPFSWDYPFKLGIRKDQPIINIERSKRTCPAPLFHSPETVPLNWLIMKNQQLSTQIYITYMSCTSLPFSWDCPFKLVNYEGRLLSAWSPCWSGWSRSAALVSALGSGWIWGQPLAPCREGGKFVLNHHRPKNYKDNKP